MGTSARRRASAIAAVAEAHGLKVIYDAAHCFGTLYKGESVFNYGDIVTTSFHATKLFHTVEGGAVFTHDPDLLKRLAYMRNFGHDGPESFQGLGVNGKNSEFHAAMGLSVLPEVESILAMRKQQSDNYDELLTNLRVIKPAVTEHCTFNYAYYAVMFEDERQLLAAMKELNRREIFPRRYFYPSLSKLSYVADEATPVSDDVSSRILCLPLYHTLSREEQQLIARILIRTQRYE